MEESSGNGGSGGRARRLRRLLVLEPDYQRRIYAAQILARLGFRVVLAAEGEEAASLIARQAARLDGVLANLPDEARAGLDGAIAAHRPNLPVFDLAGETYSAERLGALLGPARIGP